MGNYTFKYIAIGLVTLVAQSLLSPPADAKLTITQRQNILLKKINRAERANELTHKEAQGLRDKRLSIIAMEARMRNRNNGRLSYSDINKVERELNGLSLKLQKKALAKRVD
ncbi:MAG: hypothetical protein SFY67_16060 [Candidatus Melainabacteria bacterium]|nr:hypothetical protein [Candidatus Melainabacteria bacterium]